jgi:biotin transport system substrate-specific component
MKTKNMMYVALFAAVMCVLGLLPPIPLPFTPVPITAQTLGIMLAGGILGARLGGLSIIVFLMIVAVGAPVLSGGRGGFSVFFGPSAGYLISWPVATFLIGWMTERLWNKLTLGKAFVINILFGIIFVYAIGVSVLSFITDLPIGKAAISAIAYIPGDLIKSFIAAYLAVKIRTRYPFIQRNQSDAA